MTWISKIESNGMKVSILIFVYLVNTSEKIMLGRSITRIFVLPLVVIISVVVV